MKINSFPLVLTVLIFTACGKNSPPSNPEPSTLHSTNEISFVVQTKSPDQSLKSWWKIRDLMDEERVEKCNKDAEEKNKLRSSKILDSVMTGPALARLSDPSQCSKQTYSRDIEEVKVESETRAVILATIKATTPIPPNAQPDANDIKKRAEGFQYKYVLEKINDAWKIAQIYEYNIYSTNNERWKPVFPEEKSIYVHSYMWGAQ